MTTARMWSIALTLCALAPLAAWVARLRARGVITHDRPLDRVIRERITGRPAPLTRPDYRRARLRYFRFALLIAPLATVALTTILGVLAQPRETLGLIVAPAFGSGMVVLVASEERFRRVSQAARIITASLSGLIAAIVAALVIGVIDPHALLVSSTSFRH